MKLTAIALTALLAAALPTAATPTPDNVAPAKPPSGATPPPGTFQGGDTIETCTEIDELPYSTTGTTSGFVDDYDEVCPYTGSTSPDCVYCWEADFTGFVDIHTCESGYDTKIYVYENEYTPGQYHACNDDNPDCQGPVFRSWIEGMPVTTGSTYFIVVDGYGGDYGDYLFNMYEAFPVLCDPHACPPGAFEEDEPDCYDGYIDETNIGCNGDPPIFQYPPFPTAICGTSGNYDDNEYRDMDWFEFTFPAPLDLEVCVCAEFQVRVFVFLGGCGNLILIANEAGPPGRELCVQESVGLGTYIVIITTDGWLNIPCGSDYWATVREAGHSAVEQASWGTIKARYR
jgi:hypothetical protein